MPLLVLLLVVAAPFGASGAQAESGGTTAIRKQFLDPAEGFSHLAVIDANGVRTIYVSGQTSSAEGYAAQTAEASRKLVERLAKAGADAGDIVKLTTYVVGWEAEKIAEVGPAMAPLYTEGQLPAHTFIGVETLYEEQYLIEIEAVAILPTPDEKGAE